jgi:hypothetical protein
MLVWLGRGDGLLQLGPRVEGAGALVEEPVQGRGAGGAEPLDRRDVQPVDRDRQDVRLGLRRLRRRAIRVGRGDDGGEGEDGGRERVEHSGDGTWRDRDNS